MKKATLTRTIQNETGTYGTISVNDSIFYSVELPWNNNSNNISCIPKGVYTVKWTKSPRLHKFTYEITKVPKRAGIRIHGGNFPKQFLGCIGLGMTQGTVNGKRGVFSSQLAIRKFNNLMNQEDFELMIKGEKMI